MYIPSDEAFPFIPKLLTCVTLAVTFDLHICKLLKLKQTPISQIRQLLVQDHKYCTQTVRPQKPGTKIL